MGEPSSVSPLDESAYKARDRSHLGRSVIAVERLYGFLVSLAMTELCRELVFPNSNHSFDEGGLSLGLSVLLTIAATVTAVPFFQGATVYLEDAYRGSEQPPDAKRMLFDTLSLVAQGILLFFVCASIRYGHQFLLATMLVFLTDPVLDFYWGRRSAVPEVLTQPARDASGELAEVRVQERPQTPRWLKLREDFGRLPISERWFRTNLATLIVLLVITVTDVLSHGHDHSAGTYTALFAGGALVLRGVFDYAMNHRYYFSAA